MSQKELDALYDIERAVQARIEFLEDQTAAVAANSPQSLLGQEIDRLYQRAMRKMHDDMLESLTSAEPFSVQFTLDP